MKLSVRIVPNASRDEIVGWQADALKIKIKAVPEGGRANKALIAFLGKHLKLSKKNIRILQGETARNKLLEIEDLDESELKERISGK